MARRPSHTEREFRKAVLVGVRHANQPDTEQEESIAELSRLSRTAGIAEAGRMSVRVQQPHAAWYIGKGRAEDIAQQVRSLTADTVVFDEELSPAQARNLERLCGVPVIDRTQVILDIFALHARSREGKLQVELARLEYLLPRLRRMWVHLERQRGGIGVRGGPGEQQLEVDRRRIEQRLVRLRAALRRVGSRRAEQRRGRRRHGWALASLVGYTNAGKTTLLNRLTGTRAPVRDQLFVTLDPTTRKVDLPNHQPVLLTDTVGFIRKLPHDLVEAFKATLEEVVESDVLLHVIDASHEQAAAQIEAVQAVLKDLGADHKPVLAVLNKIDCPGAAQRARTLEHSLSNTVTVSAATGEGVDDVMAALADELRERMVQVSLRIPFEEGKILAALRASGRVLSERTGSDALYIMARVPRDTLWTYAAYVTDGDGGRSPEAS